MAARGARAAAGGAGCRCCAYGLAWAKLEHAFRQGLTQAGYIENQNVAIEWRWLEGRYEHLPGTLGELVNHRVAAIVVPGSAGAALTAKAATQTVPIEFMTGSDPVELGLVASLAHPGGNITGAAMLQTLVAAKRLDLLHHLIPHATTIALLTNLANPFGEAERRRSKSAKVVLVPHQIGNEHSAFRFRTN